ncbi:phage holin family protein [Oscillatoria sp. CS-180]|uniref:phage holin family protein n=1 Tax=Oscillatoria sp. CS-180 TaxID=3021720 RepID=UPI00232D0CA4|nr:phage holin family protein [Oscillatoria sp. CS-180]MDB9528663.1 phage holin family protein [Oscillatoria sp. CS-180]
MVSILLSGLVTALSLLVVDLIVPGVQLDTITATAIAAASVGVVNAFIKPAISTLAIPVNLLSFGLFSYIVNGLCFWLASLAVPGFRVSGILGFLLGPVVLSFVSTFLSKYLADKYPQMMEGVPNSNREIAGTSNPEMSNLSSSEMASSDLSTTES